MKEKMDIQFIDLKSQYQALKPSIDARIQRVLDHGQYIMGPEVAELEEKLEAYTGAKHCITVASGTEARLIALMALGIKSGDEVITTPFTFIDLTQSMIFSHSFKYSSNIASKSIALKNWFSLVFIFFQFLINFFQLRFKPLFTGFLLPDWP